MWDYALWTLQSLNVELSTFVEINIPVIFISCILNLANISFTSIYRIPTVVGVDTHIETGYISLRGSKSCCFYYHTLSSLEYLKNT